MARNDSLRYLGTLIPLCVVIFLLKISLLSTDSPADVSEIKGEKKIDNSLYPVSNPLSKCNIPPKKQERDFIKYMDDNHLECTNFRYFGMGPDGDGKKGACLDDFYRPIPGKCNVLSFGINNEWSFDDDMGTYGCKVFSFDPTINKEDHKRSENITFFNLGISNQKAVEAVGKVDTYKGILEKIGLANSVVDYLKVDIEYAEVRVLNDIFANYPHLLQNVRQFALEAHYRYQDGRDVFWTIFHKIECLGFRIISARHFVTRSEIVWVHAHQS